jgi:large subunit ribosomal protein L9
MQYKVILLEDLENIAKKGEIISVKPGFARNFLLPQKKAMIVDKRTLRLQERLQKERDEQSKVDREESMKLSKALEGFETSLEVKVDPDGNMYGSVSHSDIAKLLKEHGYEVDRKFIAIQHPIRSLGSHTISLNLKENVEASFTLKIKSDRPLPKLQREEEEKKQQEKEKKEAAEKEEDSEEGSAEA